MYFGDFLITKNIIDHDHLLDALIYQIDHLPSILSILKNRMKFSGQDLLNIIGFQHQDASDIITAIRRHSLISDEEVNKALQIQAQERAPLGQILISKKIITADQLEDLLTEFIEEKESVPAVLPLENHKKYLAQLSFKTLTSLEIEQLSKCFDQSKIDQVNKMINQLQQTTDNSSTDEYEKNKNEFISAIHIFKGLSRVIDTKMLEDGLAKIESFFDKCPTPDKDKIELIKDLFNSVIELKASIEQNSTEEIYAAKNGEKYFMHINNLN